MIPGSTPRRLAGLTLSRRGPPRLGHWRYVGRLGSIITAAAASRSIGPSPAGILDPRPDAGRPSTPRHPALNAGEPHGDVRVRQSGRPPPASAVLRAG